MLADFIYESVQGWQRKAEVSVHTRIQVTANYQQLYNFPQFPLKLTNEGYSKLSTKCDELVAENGDLRLVATLMWSLVWPSQNDDCQVNCARVEQRVETERQFLERAPRE